MGKDRELKRLIYIFFLNLSFYYSDLKKNEEREGKKCYIGHSSRPHSPGSFTEGMSMCDGREQCACARVGV